MIRMNFHIGVFISKMKFKKSLLFNVIYNHIIVYLILVITYLKKLLKMI